MSLHPLVEPAGTLLTGWKLVPRDPARADIRNKDEAETPNPAEADRTGSPPDTAGPAGPRSKWEVGEVG